MLERRRASDGGDGGAAALGRVRRTGDRLRSTLRAMLGRLPAEGRGISAMSRYLGVHKATCQRLVEGLEGREGDGGAALTRLPGVQGLRLVVRAARARGVPASAVDAAERAVDEYGVLMRELGVTQRGLARLVGAAGRVGGEESGELVALGHRRALYGAARDVTGEAVEVKSGVILARPDPADPRRLRVSIVAGLSGARREVFSRPIVPLVIGGPGSRPGPTPEILQAFTTGGISGVALQGDAGVEGRTALVLELPPARERGRRGAPAAQGPADVAVLFAGGPMPNPLADPGARIDFATRVTQPCRLLVLDVLVTRDLARVCRPVAGCFALSAPAGTTAAGAPERCWYDRFPETPGVRVRRGRAAMGEPSSAIAAGGPGARHAALVAELLRREGVDAAGLVGYRVEVEYPVWQTDYRLYLYTPEGAAAGPGRAPRRRRGR